MALCSHALCIDRRPGLSLFERFLLENNRGSRLQIFERLHWPDLTNLSAASRVIHRLVTSHKADTWNIDTFLRVWFDIPLEFRAILAFTGALATGVQVLRFFDGCSPIEDTGLDIVTRVGGVPGLVLFVEEDGYVKSPAGGDVNSDAHTIMSRIFSLSSSCQFQDKGRVNGVVDVLEYAKPRNDGRRDGDVKVRIIVVTQSPIEHILLTYHSTGVMNFFSHREAISFFPATTYLSRLFIPCSRADLGFDWNPAWKSQYERMGFLVDSRRLYPRVRLGLRTPKDKHSWVIPFKETDRRIEIEAGRAVYGLCDLDSYTVDLIWLAEDFYGFKHWRIAIYEPQVFWYLAPLYARRNQA